MATESFSFCPATKTKARVRNSKKSQDTFSVFFMFVLLVVLAPVRVRAALPAKRRYVKLSIFAIMTFL